MEIKVNKEVRDYTESLFMGLSVRQCVYSAIACVVAVFLYFRFEKLLGLELTSWLCIIGALPFAALGFICFQSMSAGQIVMTVIKSFILSHRQLIDQPFNLYFEAYKGVMSKYDKKLFKIEKNKIKKNLEFRKQHRIRFLLIQCIKTVFLK